MGTMQLSEFRTELRFLMENRSDLVTGADARMNRWINAAYLMVSIPSTHRQRELEDTVVKTLVTDTFEYSLASDSILGVRSARYVNAAIDSFTATQRRSLQPVSLGWFNSRRHTTNANGPTQFSIFRDNLVVSPGPDSNSNGNIVVLEIWRQPTRLSIDTQKTVLLDYWDQAILIGAKWLAELSLGYGEFTEGSRQDFAAITSSFPDREDIGMHDEEGWFPDMNTGDPIGTR